MSQLISMHVYSEAPLYSIEHIPRLVCIELQPQLFGWYKTLSYLYCLSPTMPNSPHMKAGVHAKIDWFQNNQVVF